LKLNNRWGGRGGSPRNIDLFGGEQRTGIRGMGNSLGPGGRKYLRGEFRASKNGLGLVKIVFEWGKGDHMRKKKAEKPSF